MLQAKKKIDLYEKKFAIIDEISSAIVVTDNVQAIANLMLDMAVGYTNAEKGSLLLASDGELTMFAARGIDLRLMQGYRIKIGEGIAGTVARNLEPVLVEDIDSDPRFRGRKRDRYKTRSFISCPIVSRNKLLGVFNVNDKKDGTPFTEDEFALLRIIANQAAITLENALLMAQLRSRAAEQEEMNTKLIEMDLVKTEFLTRVSHELRTPLNSIKGAIYYLQQSDELPIPGSEFHDIISAETSRLISIVENQLDFLRLEDETKLMKKTLVGVAEVLREVEGSRALANALGHRRVRLELEDSPAVPAVVADRVRMIQMLANLVDGLASLAEEEDTIRLAAHEGESIDVVVTLSRPVAPSLLPYLFQFKHLRTGDDGDDRLKLYLAKRVADLHEWKLIPENTGDTFTVTVSIPPSGREKIDAAINTAMDLYLEVVAELLDVETASIMLREADNDTLTIRSARGLDPEVVKRTRLTPGERIAGWVAIEGKPLFVEDIDRDPRFPLLNATPYRTKSLIALPLEATSGVVGVLNLNNKKNQTAFDRYDFELGKLLGERISRFLVDLDYRGFSEETLKRLRTEFELLLGALKKYRKKGGILPALTRKIMTALGADEGQAATAAYAAMIYDLGLTLIDHRVLQKKGLQPKDVGTVRVHPYSSIGLLNCFEFSDDVKRVVLHHHERFDGKGYPEELEGTKIPLGARVLAVVDAFAAMQEERPWRPALSEDEALAEIRKEAGRQFDPEVVRALGSLALA